MKKRLKTLVAGLAASLTLAGSATTFVVANQSNPQAEPQDQAQTSSLSAAAALPACRRQSAANSAGQDIVLSTASPFTYTGAAWQDVHCTGTTFRLKSGERAVVVADVSAETDCNGTNPANGQWC